MTVRPVRLLKSCANLVALTLMAPLAAPCWIEAALTRRGEQVFTFVGHLVALLPGLPGSYLRRGFYRLTLDGCDAECHIGFGSFCSHRQVIIERHVYIGPYAIIGSSHLRQHALIGSRVSILSGVHLHVLDAEGQWTPSDLSRLQQVEIGTHAWIGEGAIVMAAVGAHTMVAAGAVVSMPVSSGVVVAGNPARFVRRLGPGTAMETEPRWATSAVTRELS